MMYDPEALNNRPQLDLYVDEEEVENLLRTIEEELHNLRKGAAVRIHGS